jgi:hypothetical protein
MRKLLYVCLFAVSGLVTPAIAQAPLLAAVTEPMRNDPHASLQSRFDRLQQVARSTQERFDLQLVGEGQSLFGQRGDGVIRLPEDWVAAAPDRQTLDFLMLLALSDALAREPAREEPGAATKVITGAIAFIGVNAAKNAPRSASRDPGLHFAAARFAPIPSLAERGTALRALSWAVASGGCEAKIVAGLRRLETVAGAIGTGSRQIVKDLGAVAWTPDERCGPPVG